MLSRAASLLARPGSCDAIVEEAHRTCRALATCARETFSEAIGKDPDAGEGRGDQEAAGEPLAASRDMRE